MIHTSPAAVVPALTDAIHQAERILILSHVNPDGDAIGSMLGVWHVLQAMGKTAIPIASSAYPAYMATLPGIEHVQVYEPGTELPEVDLVWMVDTANPQRIGKIYNDHAAFLENHPLVIVDHHVTNTGLGTVNLIDSDAASCAELLYALFAAMEAPVTPEAATCLLMGLTTDTQSFQTSSTRAQSLRVAADLMEHGANNYAIVQQVYYSTAYSTAHLLGLSLSKLQHDDGLIWTHISQEMADTTGADDAAYDDVVAVMQRIEGMKIVVLFKERSEGVKISLRSKPGVDVSELAKIWGGGGHAQAAGATLNMDLAAAEREVLSRLRTYLAK